MSTPLPPPSSTITPTQLTHILTLYPSTLRAVYAQNPRLKDAGKLSAAVGEDGWRYEGLSGVVKGRGKEGKGGTGKGEGGWLEKEEVERLVGWKITHGPHRPFLPSLIRQNPPDLIKSTTATAFSSISKTPITSSSLTTALTTLTKPLKGIGPATASLILSIHDPENIPFFSDELYAWLVHSDTNSDAASGTEKKKKEAVKLKYDIKEYERLFEAWTEFKERMGGGVRAVDVERVAWVVGHWRFVDEVEGEGKGDSREEGDVVEMVGGNGKGNAKGDVDEEEEKSRGDEIEEGVDEVKAGEQLHESRKRGKNVKRDPEITPGKSSKAVKEEKHVVDNDDKVRRSKRLKKA